MRSSAQRPTTLPYASAGSRDTSPTDVWKDPSGAVSPTSAATSQYSDAAKAYWGRNELWRQRQQSPPPPLSGSERRAAPRPVFMPPQEAVFDLQSTPSQPVGSRPLLSRAVALSSQPPRSPSATPPTSPFPPSVLSPAPKPRSPAATPSAHDGEAGGTSEVSDPPDMPDDPDAVTLWWRGAATPTFDAYESSQPCDTSSRGRSRSRRSPTPAAGSNPLQRPQRDGAPFASPAPGPPPPVASPAPPAASPPADDPARLAGSSWRVAAGTLPAAGSPTLPDARRGSSAAPSVSPDSDAVRVATADAVPAPAVLEAAESAGQARSEGREVAHTPAGSPPDAPLPQPDAPPAPDAAPPPEPVLPEPVPPEPDAADGALPDRPGGGEDDDQPGAAHRPGAAADVQHCSPPPRPGTVVQARGGGAIRSHDGSWVLGAGEPAVVVAHARDGGLILANMQGRRSGSVSSARFERMLSGDDAAVDADTLSGTMPVLPREPEPEPAEQPPPDAELEPGAGGAAGAAPRPYPALRPAPRTATVVDLGAAAQVLWHETERRSHFRRFVRALGYFVLIVVIAALQSPPRDAHHCADALKSRVVDPTWTDAPDLGVRGVSTIPELWDWLEQVWAPALYAAAGPSTGPRMGPRDTVALSPTLRVRRRKQHACDSPLVQPFPAACYSDGPATDFWVVFASGAPAGADEGSWPADMVAGGVYVAEDSGGDGWDRGTLAAYHGNVSNGVEAAAVVAGLRQQRWLAAGAEELEASVTTALRTNVDLLCTIRLRFGIGSSGDVRALAPGSFVQVRRVDMYSRTADRVRMVLELLFILVTVLGSVFKYEEVRRARRKGASALAYFTSRAWVWNWFEAVYTATTLAVFAVQVRLASSAPVLGQQLKTLDGLLEPVSATHAAAKALGAALICLTAVRVVRHLGFVSGWRLLLRTAAYAVPPLITAAAAAIVVGGGFAAAAHAFFGAALPQYAYRGRAMQASLEVPISGLRYRSISAPEADVSYGIFPPVYFWAVSAAMVFVASGVVTALVVVAHARARAALVEHDRVQQLALEWRARCTQHGWRRLVPVWLYRLLDRTPKSLLEALGSSEDGEGRQWLVPLMVDYPATSRLVAEAWGSTLRLHLTVPPRFQAKLCGARGLAVVLPDGALAPGWRPRHGWLAQAHAGQAPQMTAAPLVGAEAISYLCVGRTLRTRGSVDLATVQGKEVVIEFPNALRPGYQWPADKVLARVDIVTRLRTYGGCFTHSPADWLSVFVACPEQRNLCPFLVRVPRRSAQELRRAVEQAALGRQAVTGVLALAQLFGSAERSEGGGQRRGWHRDDGRTDLFISGGLCQSNQSWLTAAHGHPPVAT